MPTPVGAVKLLIQRFFQARAARAIRFWTTELIKTFDSGCGIALRLAGLPVSPFPRALDKAD